MKRLRLVAPVCALIILIGCVYLPIKTKEKLSLKEVLEIYELLNKVEYPREYEYDIFDCSNQTALLYDYFTKKGFKCEIMVGWKPPWHWHSWLIVKKDDKEFWIEATTKQLWYPCCYEEYILKFRFCSLKFLRFFSKLFFISNEWNY